MDFFDFFSNKSKKNTRKKPDIPRKPDIPKKPDIPNIKEHDLIIRPRPVVPAQRPHSAKLPKAKPEDVSNASKQEGKKNINIINDLDYIEDNLQLVGKPNDFKLELYCSILEARIICHSILVDKLGDFTKFIIISLYKGHSIDEITELTQMGAGAIADEIQFLIRGNLANNDNEILELTELGKEYGKLLVQFEELSVGIPVYFNTASDSFEEKTITTLDTIPENAFVLQDNYISPLTRNDNYSNSLKIAKDTIQNDTAFCWEVRDSLYTTVIIEKDPPSKKYRRVSLSEFDYIHRFDNGSCVTVAVPYDRITYRLKYSKLDEYRDSVDDIKKLYEIHPNLVTKKAADIVALSNEECEAEEITRDINCITGKVRSRLHEIEEKELTKSMIVLDGQKFSLKVNSRICKGVYLEEINRKRYYEINFYNYRQLEID